MQRRTMVAVGLATLGLVLSLLLERLHVQAYLSPSAESFCAVGERLDCTTVALSRWSVIGGVPVPLWGAVGFFAIGVAAFRRSAWLLPLTGVAALISAALLVVELASIGALCLLCEAVHLVTFVLFGLAWRMRGTLSSPLGNRDDLVYVFGLPVGVLVALFFFLPPYWAAFGWKGAVPFAHGKTEDGHPWIGAADPKLTLHEFTDYACPHCKAASARMLRRLAQRPELRLVRRQYPRVRCQAGVANSCLPVRMAYCADEQGKFWHADRWLFEHASQRVRLEPRRAAEEIGLDAEKLIACVARSDIYDRAVADSALALKYRLPGTPYYMAGDRRAPESGLAKLLEQVP
jgi:uncharacterized membrane protein